MRVALFHNLYHFRGGEDTVVEFEERLLRDAGVEVFRCALRNDDYLTPLRPAGVHALLSAPHNRRAHRRVRNFLRDNRCDLGHVHNWFPLFSPSIYQAHRDSGVPVVQTLHNYRLGCGNGLFLRDGERCYDCLDVGRQAAVTHRCYRDSRALSLLWKRTVDRAWRRGTLRDDVSLYLSPSRSVADLHVRMGLPEERILVLPHACEDLLEGAEHAPPPAGAGALFFGRLAHPKGIDVVLRAWEELDVPLHVVGSGPSEPEVRALAERRPDVRWTPHISREGVAEAIRAAAFVVAPHLQHEAFGLTSIEAQACGRPVIASDLGGPAETIVAGETGALVPPGDIEAFAAEVRRFAEERDATRRMGAAARERYLAHYHPAPHGERLLAAFRGLVENRRRAA